MSKDNATKGSINELLTQQVNHSNKAIIKSMTKPHAFTWQQVEIAERWARKEPYSQIRKSLGINYDSQISVSLKKFELTAKVMFEAVRKLSHVGYYEKLLKESGKIHDFLAQGRKMEEQMLREGLWPFGGVPWGYKLGEDRSLQLDPEKKNILRMYIQRCADGEVNYRVARELGIPHNRIYNILDNPLYKGQIKSILHRGEILRVDRSLAAVEEEAWDKAHALHVEMFKSGKKRHPAPLWTKWVGNELVPDDPENKLGRLCELRLQRFGCVIISRELKISYNVVLSVIKRLPLYVKLGMIDAGTCERVQKICLSSKDGPRIMYDINEGKILNALLQGPGTSSDIMKRTGLSGTAVLLHLHRLKEVKHIVDREVKVHGKWYLKSQAKAQG